jgi:flagellar export protein FliJ
MKQFVWRLQKVLDVKGKEEQLRRTELFRLTERLAAKRGELLMRQRVLQDAMADIRADTSPQRVGVQELFLKYTAANDEQIRKLSDEVSTLEQEQKRKTAEVLAIRRFKKGLEKLREEARRRFIEEQEKLEQKTLDEMTTTAFARNQSIRNHDPHAM